MSAFDPSSPPSAEAVVLAAGRSSRMGRSKGLLRLGGRPLVGWIRTAALDAGLPCTILRRDDVPPCGPVGGMLTALRSTRFQACLFLSCDMPFVSSALLRLLIHTAQQSGGPVFVGSDRGPGFPNLVWTRQAPLLLQAVQERCYRLQNLAERLNAISIPGQAWESELFNINTPGDWIAAQDLLARRSRSSLPPCPPPHPP